MGRKFSELTCKDVGGEKNFEFLKKIFTQKVKDPEDIVLPGKASELAGQVVKIKLNTTIYFCQIRMDEHQNYHCVSYIENEDGTIGLGSFTMILFSGKDNLSLEELIKKYNFSQSLYNCELIYNMEI